MDSQIPDKRNPRSSSFQRVMDAFLAQPGLPFASLLSAERIEQIFAKHDALFGGARRLQHSCDVVVVSRAGVA